MKKRKDVKQLIKKWRVVPRAEIHEGTLTAVLQAHAETKKTKTVTTQPTIKGILIKSKITKLAAAAVIIIGIAVVVNQLGESIDGASVTYAISEIPNSIRQAKTIYIRGRNYYPSFPVTDVEQEAATFEYWLDKEKGRARFRYPSYHYWVDQRRVDIFYLEDVITEKCRMHINHLRKAVSFYELQKDENQYFISQKLDAQLKQIFGAPEQVEAFILQGEEHIDDSVFDMWEANMPDQKSEGMIRIRMWISPSSGEIGRISLWVKTAETDWSPSIEIDEIEREPALSSDIFDMTVPEGYLVKNDKHTPIRPELGRTAYFGKDLAISIFLGFMLEDGSIIAAWSSAESKSGSGFKDGEDFADTTQIELFEDLQSGDPLPKLPVVPTGLRKRSLWGSKTFYTGRHLAYTIRDNKIYEWTIYVAEKKINQSLTGFSGLNVKQTEGYDAILEFNPKELSRHWDYKMSAYVKFLVNQENFETLLLGYMANCSDDGIIPDHVTYDEVLDLADQIRASITR